MLIVCELADHNKSTHVLPATLLPSDLQSQSKQVGTLTLDTVFFLLLAHLILPMLFIILTHQILHTNIGRARSQHSVPTILTETSLWQRKQESVSCAVDDVFSVS